MTSPSRLLREGFRRGAGTLTASAILAFALIVALTGTMGTSRAINASFLHQRRIAHGELTLRRMTELQIAEENDVRAFVISRNPRYADAYHRDAAEFSADARRLNALLTGEEMAASLGALRDYEQLHADWYALIAQPLLKHPSRSPRELDKRGEYLIATEADQTNFLQARLERDNAAVAAQTQQAIDSTLYERAAWLTLFGLAAILLNAFRTRATKELEEERTTTNRLQRAFRSRHVPLRHCTVGSAYAPAHGRLAVGGDVFDVHPLSDHQALVLMADVSGKGIDAAVLTAFIKFTLRGIALRVPEPAAILGEFNRAFPRAVDSPYIFVSMFLGIIDTRLMELTYASAGHDPIFLRRGGVVRPLDVTGPILGVMEGVFEPRRLAFELGDMLVLSTDGLTEARDANGTLLGAEGAQQWIAEGPDDPSLLAHALVERVRRRSGRLRDDVAVLAIRSERARLPQVMLSEEPAVPAESRSLC